MKFAWQTGGYYEGPGDYRFAPDYFETWLRRAVGKRVKPSEYWTRTYGKDWTLVFNLSAKKGRKKPKIIYGPDVDRREKTVEWGISVDYVGNKSLDPKAYVGPIRQFLEGVVVVLDKLEIDTSKLSKNVPAAIKEFCSNRYMICEEITAENYGGPYVISQTRSFVTGGCRNGKFPRISSSVLKRRATMRMNGLAPFVCG
jgi:hypothetical protein